MTGYAIPPIPRAIVGGVRCMARPRRPLEEIQAVQAAAAIVRQETGLSSAKAIGREIAKRVLDQLRHDLKGDPLDLALAAIERSLLHSPFQQLASCPKANVSGEFVDRQVSRLVDRAGRYLTPMEQASELDEIAVELADLLAQRYARQVRSA